MPDWIRKPGSIADPIEMVLEDDNGPISLPPGSSVLFRIKAKGAVSAKVMAAGQVVSPGARVGDSDRGRIRYTFTEQDLDTPAIYQVDTLVQIAGLGPQPFPLDGGYMYLLVLPGADQI